MDRRNFLQIIPLAALSPKVVQEGVLSLELPKGGHFVILVQAGSVDLDQLTQAPGILPEGSTGGYIVTTYGPPEDVIKFYNLKEESPSADG